MRVLALDVGSSSVRACAYDERGREAVPAARRTYEARHDRDGAAELDPEELVSACQAVLAEAGPGDALAISCFMHSLLLLDADDRPLTPVLLWQDRRAAAQAEELAARLDPAAVHARTGCFLHPSFWPARLAWLGARAAEASGIVSFADYLFLRLTGELRTTISTASATGLLDLRARRRPTSTSRPFCDRSQADLTTASVW
jgi:gluconokinase